MSWLKETLDRLAQQPICGYHAGGPAAVEPTALTAMALWAHSRLDVAGVAMQWLADLQSSRGSLGVDATHATPCWPTGWAVLAWQLARNSGASMESRTDSKTARLAASQRALEWLLATKGTSERNSAIMGHDTTLQAWPWIEGTHSWIEPSAISLLALKAMGYGDDPRSREAVKLLLDRMLPGGGWNQGNKIVLDRVLRPQIEPTGLALAALIGEREASEPAQRSVAYLEKALGSPVSTTSLSYALIGMAAHGRRPADADQKLAAACSDTLRHGASPYPLALAALAALGTNCPWFQHPAKPSSEAVTQLKL